MRGLVLAVACLGFGCSQLRYQSAHPCPPPPMFIIPDGTAIAIRDARPDWERKPLRGPQALLAFQQVTPSPWDALKAEIEQAIATAPVKPERVEVTTSAYRVVIREREPELPRELEGTLPGRDEPTSFLKEIVGVFVGGAVESATGPPAEVQAAPEGASCTLEVDVRVTWPGGKVTGGRVDGRGAVPTRTSTPGWRDAVERSVRQANSEFGIGVRRLVLAGPTL